LIGKIQQLSAEKLAEVNSLLEKVEDQFKSKENTLSLAGIWKDLDDTVFAGLTENLHQNRSDDRKINSL
jgi:hypothetical protein